MAETGEERDRRRIGKYIRYIPLSVLFGGKFQFEYDCSYSSTRTGKLALMYVLSLSLFPAKFPFGYCTSVQHCNFWRTLNVNFAIFSSHLEAAIW